MAVVLEDAVVRYLPDFAYGEPGGWDPDRRLKDLDEDGVYGDVMYPTLAFWAAFRARSSELAYASARIYNDAVRDQFVGVSQRFCPAAVIPIQEVDASVAELERCVGMGYRTAALPAHTDHSGVPPYNDERYEPLWAAAVAAGIPLAFHVGTGRNEVRERGPGGAVINYAITLSSAIETLAYFAASGILDRHPDLSIVLVECGAGWLAWCLNAIDESYEEHAELVSPKLSAPPSELFKRQGHVTFQHDQVAVNNLPFTGHRPLLWGSDYPHAEGTWPESAKAIEAQFGTLEPEVAAAIAGGTAKELYHF